MDTTANKVVTGSHCIKLFDCMYLDKVKHRYTFNNIRAIHEYDKHANCSNQNGRPRRLRTYHFAIFQGKQG